MSRFSKQIFTIIIFSLIFISCGGNSTSEVVEIKETTTTLTTTTSTSTTTTTLTTTTSTLPDIMPTVLINCEPVESFTMAEGYMNFNFEITTGTNELVVLNIVSWFDSSRTDDLFIYDGLPSPGSSNEFGYRVDDNFSQYEIEIVVMDSKDNFANDYCLYEQNPDESNPSTTTTTTTTTPTTTTTTVPASNIDSKTVVDTSLTFEATPPFVYFEIIKNKVSDTEIPIINYELAPYAIGNPDMNCNGRCFKFNFVQFGWTDSNHSFQLSDSDLDGVADELVRSSKQEEKPWVYDYWIEEQIGYGKAVDWLRLKEDYYFMANQDYLKPNLTSIGIRFCFGDYNRAYRAGFGYYEDRIWPDNCPYEHFFLVYQYGDSVAEVDGQTYPQKPDVVEHYGVRVFGP